MMQSTTAVQAPAWRLTLRHRRFVLHFDGFGWTPDASHAKPYASLEAALSAREARGFDRHRVHAEEVA